MSITIDKLEQIIRQRKIEVEKSFPDPRDHSSMAEQWKIEQLHAKRTLLNELIEIIEIYKQSK